VTNRLLWSCILLPLLAACQFRPPALPYHETPAAPLMQDLERQRRAYPGVKALARVETERKGRKRVYESVAVLQRGLEKFRVEGYGPLGEPLFALVWDGASLAVRSPGQQGFTQVGSEALERLLGMALAPAELAAVLSGNAPSGVASAAGCSSDGRCAVDLPVDGGVWRVHLVRRSGSAGGPVQVDALERFQGSSLAFLVRYEAREDAGSVSFPKRVVVESPSRKVSLRVEYQDAELTAAVDDGAFTTTGEAAP